MTLISGRKMGGSGRPINTFFRWGWLLALLAGCATTPEAKQAKAEKKEFSMIRLFAEVRDPSAGGTKVELPRSSPQEIRIEPEAFADERDLVRAEALNAVGGFAIRVQLTEHGRMALEQASVTHAGLRLVVYGEWTQGKDEETIKRWLAAPVMRNALKNGIIVFTPDCDREEATRYVRGLNNLAIKLKNQEKPKKTPAEKPKAEPAEAKSKQPEKTETPKEKNRRERKAAEKAKADQKSAARQAMEDYENSRK